MGESGKEREKDSILPLLKNRNCLSLWSASMVSAIGNNISYIALSYYVFEKTKSPLSVGVLMIMFTFPSVFFGVPAGYLVDRLPKKKMMILIDLTRAALMAAITLTGRFNAIFALIFASYLLNQVYYNGRDGLIPSLVDEEDLAPTNSFLQSSLQVASFLGPALGGFIVAFGGVTLAVYIDAATFVASAAIITLLKPREEKREKSTLSRWKELTGGFGVLKEDVLLRVLLVLVALSMVSIGMVRMLLVVLSEGTLSVGSEGLGTLMSALALGSFSGSLLLGRVGKTFSMLTAMVTGYLILAVTFIGIPAGIVTVPAPFSFWIAVALLFIAGIGNMAVLIGIVTTIQQRTPREKIGRVFGVNYMLNGIGSITSLVVGGWAAGAVGAETTFFVSGVFLLVLTAAMYSALGKERKHES